MNSGLVVLLVFAKAPDADDSSSALQQSTTFGLFHVRKRDARMSFAPSCSLANLTTRLTGSLFRVFAWLVCHCWQPDHAHHPHFDRAATRATVVQPAGVAATAAAVLREVLCCNDSTNVEPHV